MSPWKPILAALVIFAAGVVTGGLTTQFTARRPSRPPPPFFNEGATFRSNNTNLLNRMERELALTADQRQRIAEVLRESQERTHQLSESIAPQVFAERRRTQDRIREVLTEEQRKKYDESFKMRGPGRFGGREGRGSRGGNREFSPEKGERQRGAGPQERP